MTPNRHSISVTNSTPDKGKHEIVYYDWGNPDAQRVAVCVHGLTRNARDFDFLAQQLAATGRRVLCINVSGRGESEWLADPMGYTYANYVADCIAVMDNFHLREVEWIGTSMGGIIGMMIAASAPHRIKKLVLNDIGAFLSKAALQRIYDYVRTMPTRFASREEADIYLHNAFAPFAITDPVLWDQFVEHSLVRKADGIIHYACDPAIAVPLAIASNHFTEVQDVNLEPVWKEIQMPTLVLHGADSDVLTADTIRAMRSTNLNMESVTFQGVGHAPPLITDAQTRPILQWLDRSVVGLMAASF